MPTLEQVEQSIFNLEGFHVAFKRRSRTTGRLRDARSDMKRLPLYPYANRFQSDRTVNDWVQTRAEPLYGEHDLVPVVLYGDGSPAPAQTKMQTVRNSY